MHVAPEVSPPPSSVLCFIFYKTDLCIVCFFLNWNLIDLLHWVSFRCSIVIQYFCSIYSIIGYYKIIVIIPCVIQYILAAYLFYVELFISVNPITLICPSPLVTINLLSVSVRQNRLAFKFSFEEWFLLLGKQNSLKTIQLSIFSFFSVFFFFSPQLSFFNCYCGSKEFVNLSPDLCTLLWMMSVELSLRNKSKS